MARQTSRRRTWTGVALVCALVAVGAGAWVLQRWAPFADEVATPSWPDNVQPVVDYVQDVTGQTFREPIAIEFVANRDQYRASVQPESEELTDDDLAAAETDTAVGRALGLWAGDTSLTEVRDAYDNAQPIPVTWLADQSKIVINAQREAVELSPLVRAELSVRLTQALDDQLFHTVRQMQRANTSQEYQALLAVSVGHAIWVRDLYVNDFSDDELDDFYAASEVSNADWADTIADVPVAYGAIRSIGQQIGPMFVEALTEEGRTLFAAALTSSVPTALDQISLPVSKYLRRDPLEQVAAPPGPAAADVKYSDQMGPFATYLLFSTGLPLHVALTASDGWGNDRYAVYELDGRVCVDVHLVADSSDDAGRMENALNGWAQARPIEADVLVGRNGNDLYATACDPGADVQQSLPTDEAVRQYLGRAEEIQYRADESGDAGLAECAAVAFFGAHDLDMIDESFDYFAEMDIAEQGCLSTS